MIFEPSPIPALCNDSSHPSTLPQCNICHFLRFHSAPSSYWCGGTMSFAMGAHAAVKVRANMKAEGGFGDSDKSGGGQQSASFSMKNSSSDSKENPKYNEKMMMSIWGLYNRYSVHNIKSRNSYSGA